MCFIPGLDPISIGALIGGAGSAAGGAASGGIGIGTALQGLGALASAGAAVAGGKAAQNTAEYNAKVAENNATAEQQRAAYDADLIRDRVRRTVASQTAAVASSGLDVQSGTPVAILGDTTREGELDVLSRLYSGNASATASRNDATRMRAEGRAERQASVIGAGTSLLGSFGRMASNRPLAYVGA